VTSGLEERGEGAAQLVRSHRIHGELSLMTGNRADRFSEPLRNLTDRRSPRTLLRDRRR
jgi:hypothetical protein